MNVIAGVSSENSAIGELILNKPEVHNAFDDDIIAALITGIESLQAEPSVRVIWLKSEGKNFSAGADLNWMKSMAELNYEQNLADAEQLAGLMHALYSCAKPTLVTVQGAAFGGALGLIACCDIAIAEPQASFCLSEVKIGLIPAVISPYVIKAIGERAAQRYFLTAERFSAESALQLGLIHEISSSEDLTTRSAEIIKTLCNNSPQAVTKAKQLIRQVAGRPIDKPVIDKTTDAIAAIRVSGEGQEGLASFLEKRQPNWI